MLDSKDASDIVGGLFLAVGAIFSVLLLSSLELLFTCRLSCGIELIILCCSALGLLVTAFSAWRFYGRLSKRLDPNWGEVIIKRDA